MLIVKYDPNWADQFNQIKSVIMETLTEMKITIEHIGSTAVPNLSAKSIIDIDIIYYRKEDFGRIQEGLYTLGYYHNGDQGIADREVFKRQKGFNHTTLDVITHRLYACPHESEELKKHILFRNYLISHPKARKQYEKIN